jgi:glycerophosphoryl diester phosphodiesterase
MIILAHRGNLTGPEPDHENRLDRMIEAMSLGFGLETDVRRRGDGTLYISHDVTQHALVDGSDDALRHASLWRAWPTQLVALNVKELDWDAALVDFVTGNDLVQQVMLFDMELIEPVAGQMARDLHALHPPLHLAARVSDRGEPPARALEIREATSIWLDEFDSLWATRATIDRLKDAGRMVHAISPELHGFDDDARLRRWDDFARWGVDSICTDFPVAAAAHLGLAPTTVPAAATWPIR